jgi:deltex-like protein
MQEECPICLLPLGDEPAVVVKKCTHAFHTDCLKRALQMSNKCPMCRRQLGVAPIGKSPYGFLDVKVLNYTHCGGFDNIPAIFLRYDIPSGIQSAEHENPGHLFSAITRKAYLPDNEEGHNLLKRLRYAFRRGLTFTVGTSLSSGQSNVVYWASIHHKTVPGGGAHGWPDPAYFNNINGELDGLQVPKASEL